MSSKECFHFTNLEYAKSIQKNGLTPRISDNSKALKDDNSKVSFADGRYVAAYIFANFFTVYNEIKNGESDRISRTDPLIVKQIQNSENFESFLKDGMYIIFDGTKIENTGGNNGHINPYDAGTKKTINPSELKVPILKDKKTGETTYSKFDYAYYLMINLTENDKKHYSTNMIQEINEYINKHPETTKKFKEHNFEEEIISLDDFCKIYEKDTISMQNVVKNAIKKEITTEDVSKAKNIERIEDKSKSEVTRNN